MQRWKFSSLYSSLPDDFETKDDKGKMADIRNMVARGDASVLDRAWGLLGNELGMARGNPEVFSASIRLDDDILDHSAFETLKAQFRSDVEQTALGFLEANRDLVIGEMERTGTADPDAPDIPDADQDAAIQEIQKAAPEMERIHEGKRKIRSIQVGEKEILISAMMDAWTTVPVTFDPSGPDPLMMPAEGTPTWDQVNAQWLKVQASEAALIRQFPSLAFFGGGEGDIGKVKDVNDIRGARAEVSKALQTLLQRIESAVPMVGSDLTFIDFPPIHAQLLTGLTGPSGTVWSRPVEKAIALEETADANTANLLASLGLGALAAAGFILASFASGGLATAGLLVGLGASVTQAGMSIDKAFDLAAANKTTVDPDLALVTQEQVDAAVLSAVLDTVFAAVDAWQAAKPLLKAGSAMAGKMGAAKAATAARASTRIANLAQETNKAAVVAQAIAEVGPEKARAAAGMSFEQLAQIVGKDTDLGRRLVGLATEGTAETTAELLAKLPTLGAIDDAAEAEQVLRAAVNKHGYVGALDAVGGWGKLKVMTAMKGATGQALEAWRAGIVKELQEFIAAESKAMSKAVRTGTEKATSDLDVQVIGGTAQALTERAQQWLASRTGQGSWAKARRLLDAEVFVDPSRSHLIDIMKNIDPADQARVNATMAAWERKLIFGARLEEASKVGEEAVAAVRKEAAEAGVGEIPSFVRLSPAEQTKLGQQIDEWMTALKEMSDPGERAAMAEKIGKAQAQINASHADAYVGGGVALWVTGRDVDVKKLADALNIDAAKLKNVSNLQRVTAALTEAKWINAAVGRLNVGGTAEEIAKGVKDIGKHGARAAEALKAAPVGNVQQLEGLMGELLALAKATADDFPTSVSPDDIALLRRNVEGILASLRTQTSSAIREINAIAKAADIQASELADFQLWLKWELTYSERVNAALLSVARLAKAADANARRLATFPPESEPNMSGPAGPAVAPSAS